VDLAEPRQLGKSVLVGFAVTAFFAGFAYAGRLSRKDYPVTSETLGVIAGDSTGTGRQDLIALSKSDPTPFYLEGERRGRFASSVPIPARGQGLTASPDRSRRSQAGFRHADIADDG
jgi:hypothetical protein